MINKQQTLGNICFTKKGKMNNMAINTLLNTDPRFLAQSKDC